MMERGIGCWREGLQTGTRKLLEVMHMITILLMVIVSQTSKLHQIVHFKYVKLIVC